MLVSTSSPQPWIAAPEACLGNATGSCATRRGGIFTSSASSTWQDKGLFKLEAELNLGIDEIGEFGLDSLILGLPKSGAAVLDEQMVAGIASEVFYLSTWGIYPAATNLTNSNDPHPSLIQDLKQKNLIPSLSWSYTAGAFFQSQSMYDASSFRTPWRWLRRVRQRPKSCQLDLWWLRCRTRRGI